MSNIAMCDQCARIFSLNESGWDTYLRQSKQRHPSSSLPVVTGEATMHICNQCNGATEGEPLRPRLEISKNGD